MLWVLAALWNRVPRPCSTTLCHLPSSIICMPKRDQSLKQREHAAMAERLNSPAQGKTPCSLRDLPSLLAQGAAVLYPPSPDTSWPWQLFRLQLLQEGGGKKQAVVREDQTPWDQTHLAHLLSLLCMHPNWLVLICVGKNAKQVHLPSHAVVCLLCSPALCPQS